MTALEPVSTAVLEELARSEQSWVSFLLPTATSGPQTQAARTLLRSMRSELTQRFGDRPDVEQVAAQAQALEDDADFWQHQSEGLAIYCSANDVRTVSTSTTLRPEFASGAPRLRPLIAALPRIEEYAVLAVSRNQVRLLIGDETTLTEQDLGPIPANEAALPQDRDHQTHLQWSAQGGGDANFHGHGAGSEADQVAAERFLRAVVRGLDEHPQITAQMPVVLASVRETQTMIRQLWNHQGVLDEGIDGNPDELAAHELRDRATELFQNQPADRGVAVAKQLAEQLGTGRASTHHDEISAAAGEGRIDTLIVAVPAQHDGTAPEAVDDPVDELIRATLRTGGQVVAAPEGADLPDGCAALMRW